MVDKQNVTNCTEKELRLDNYDMEYDMETNLLSTETSVYKNKAFAGLELDHIVEEAEKRYQYLWQKYPSLTSNENSQSRRALHFSFQGLALVYVPKEKAWFPPSRCVWVESDVNIPGKVSIANAYPSLEKFFTAALNISKPTVEMYIDSIKAEAKGEASVARIKSTMKLICSLDVEDRDLSSLLDAKVLPIKLANGVRVFASASTKGEGVNFVILENIIHRDAFEGRIDILDFSLEEIRNTRPLLLAMGLQERFSSQLVGETTDVNGGSQDRGMTKTFRNKSQAVVRCVACQGIPLETSSRTESLAG